MGPLQPHPTSPPQGAGSIKGKGGCAAVGKGLAASDWMDEGGVSQQVREGLTESVRQMSSRGKPPALKRDKLETGYVGAAPLKAGQAKINSDKLFWVRWREEAKRTQLPGEVWEAIQSYLAASGRLVGMQDDNYIFVPLAEPGKAGENNTAGDWVGERYPEGGTPGRFLSSDQILLSLKLYGRAV